MFRELLELRLGASPPLNTFTRHKFFRLRDGWEAFAFLERDFRLLERVRRDGDKIARENLIGLIRSYAETNRDEVAALYRANRLVSVALLSDRELGSGVEVEFEGHARQSLFAIKHACASQPIAAEVIQNTLQRLFPKQSWVMTNLSYPLAYRFVAQPDVDALDVFLGYVFPYPSQAMERAVILELLHELSCDRTNFAFRTYVAMMGHPYDACETLLDDIERGLACGRRPSKQDTEFLEFAAEQCGAERAARLLHIVENGCDLTGALDPARIERNHGLAEADAKILAALLEGRTTPVPQLEGSGLAILNRMLAEPYPERKDFVRITAVQSNWSFTDGGRILIALLRALYMVERAPVVVETECANRLVALTGAYTPYIVAAPSALEALRRLEQSGCTLGAPLPEVMRHTEDWVKKQAGSGSRTWIHALQWKLRSLEDDGRVAEWLSTIRREAPFQPSYLTGVNWRWAESVIALNRLDDFMSADGAYALLLMEQEFSSDPTRLDIVLEITLDLSNLETVVEQLLDRYGEVALALVRRFLTPTNLLVNGLAEDRLSALELRVEALEMCFRRAGGKHLPEEVYRSELNALAAELLLTNLNSGMFEIPWSTFKRDSLEDFADLHKAYASLKPALESRLELSETTLSPASFPNGRKEAFRIKAVEQPLFQIIVGLIGDFFEHTAFGLEVILSGRFRHNNLQQELWAAMPESPRVRIQDVPPGLQNGVIAHYRPVMESVLEEWTNARLHTARREKPDALFDIVPSQDEVNALLDAARDVDTLEALVDIVIDWLRQKLRHQVAAAKDAFAQELPARLLEAFDKVKRETEFEEVTPGELERIHGAIREATTRKIEELGEWFDGIDSATVGAANLEQLARATEQRVKQGAAARDFTVSVTIHARRVEFLPEEVKIAFDMLREIFSNALTHGRKRKPTLTIRRVGSKGDRGIYLFSNFSAARRKTETRERFVEGAYDSIFDAIATERGSGRPKIAAICSTLVEQETEIFSIFRPTHHHLVIEMKEVCDAPA